MNRAGSEGGAGAGPAGWRSASLALREGLIVGTSVRERKYEVSIANTTDMASGTKSDLAAPLMKVTGTKTMQMQSVETRAGVAISDAPSMMARRIGFFCAMLRWTFSISTVAS